MKISDLNPAPYNPRSISDDALGALSQSVQDFGDLSGIVWNKRSGFLVCGHQRVQALKQKGASFKADAFELDGQRFPVRVVDWDEMTERAANVTANNPHISGDWTDGLSGVLEGLKDDLPDFEGLNLDKLLADCPQEETEIVEDDAPEPPGDPVTKPGDLWVLGRHRLLCGDCTSKAQVSSVMEDAKPCMVTDPPYCSGGFQESGKGAGSVGTRGDDKIANDQLSTRGYVTLIKSVLEASAGIGLVHVFTDWRMWVNLFDCAESSGFGVRAMVVWDKGSPGMGRGWRNQHELVLVGSKVSQPFNPKSAQGNVIQSGRTGNKNHPTEKPVALIAKILTVADIFDSVYDPFLGSGTTLIAAEQLGRRCFGLEIEPKYCDVVVERWQNLTGEKATREPA